MNCFGKKREDMTREFNPFRKKLNRSPKSLTRQKTNERIMGEGDKGALPSPGRSIGQK